MTDIREAALTKSDEPFNVVQFFVDGSHEYVRRNVPAKQAIEAAFHYTHNVAAVAGVTSRVIITDSDDMTCFEWISGEGITFPKRIDAPPKDYRKTDPGR